MSLIRKENLVGDPNICACIDLCTVDGGLNIEAFMIVLSILNKYNEKMGGGSSECLISDLAMLDLMGIDGDRIIALYEVCGKDLDQFELVLSMMAFQVFDIKEVLANLDGAKIDFIDDSIERGDDENFGPNSPDWAEWCEKQKESFRKRFNND